MGEKASVMQTETQGEDPVNGSSGQGLLGLVLIFYFIFSPSC